MSQSIGQLLKSTRESSNISLDEVAFQTKIPLRYLTALENNQFSMFPSQVQVKGFLRLYGSFLGINEGQLIRALENKDFTVSESLMKSDTKEEIATSNQKPDHVNTSQESEYQEKNLENDNQQITEEPFQQVIRKDIEETFESEKETARLSESQLLFIDIGEILQKQRKLLNLSIEDIERFTNIRSHYLRSLEEGEPGELPSMVQAKGLLSNYASFLNLDVDEILLKFADALQTKRNETYAPEKIGKSSVDRENFPTPTPKIWRKFLSPELLVTGFLIIALFGFILWGAANVLGDQTSPIPTSAPPSISDVLLGTGVDVTPTITITPAQTGAVADQGNGVIPEEGNPEVSIPAEGNLPLQVYLVANQRAFLRVITDGDVAFNGRSVPGNAYEYSASESIEILTGNAAAFDLYYNQEPLGQLGGTGEVLSLEFTIDQGMVTPTPQFSPTTAPTSIPTATYTPTQTPTRVLPTATPTVTPFIP